MSIRDSYPARAITFISASPPGGGWYQVCEQTIRALREEGMAPVEIRMEERKGAVPLFEEMATQRRGDPYTLVAFSPGMTIQLLNAGSKYTYADVTPIAATSTDYGVLVAAKDSPLAGLGDLVKALRKDPQALPVGGGQPPRLMHQGIISSVAFSAGMDASKVNYVGNKGATEAIAGLLGGQVAVAALGAANIVGQLPKGNMRVLAILSEKRLPGVFKDTPTAIEQGLKVTFPMWRGFYAPAGVPREAVDFWTRTLTKLAGTRTWARILEDLGWFPFLRTGKDLADFLKEDTRRYETFIRPAQK